MCLPRAILPGAANRRGVIPVRAPSSRRRCGGGGQGRLTTAAEGVDLDKDTLRREDAREATKEQVVFVIPYSAATKTPMNAELKLCLCDGRTCQTKMIPLTW